MYALVGHNWVTTFKTEEQAKEYKQKLYAMSIFQEHDWEAGIIQCYNAEELMASFVKKNEEYLESEKHRLEEDLKYKRDILIKLEKIKAVLEPYDLNYISKSEIIDLMPKLYKQFIEMELPVKLYDSQNNLTYDVANREVQNVCITRYSIISCGYFEYDIGEEYNIDDDIRKLRIQIRELETDLGVSD